MELSDIKNNIIELSKNGSKDICTFVKNGRLKYGNKFDDALLNQTNIYIKDLNTIEDASYQIIFSLWKNNIK